MLWFLAFLCGAAGIVAPSASIRGAQDDQPLVRVLSPKAPIPPGAAEVRIPIQIEGVEDLGAFTFVLEYDADVLDASDIERGSFLASSGREVLCDQPIFQSEGVRLTCVTLRSEPARGADGTGELAVVIFTTKEKGESPLTLSLVQLTNPSGVQIPSSSVDGSVRIESSGDSMLWLWLTFGAVALAVLVVASVVVLRARRSRVEQDHTL
jgi:hypothetical protein